VRVLLVVNASASSVTARARVVIQQALAADHDLSVAETSRRGHATRLAQGAAADGIDVVAVLGGDGTLNEAANGLAGTATALGVLPGGSTNVFARTIGMLNDPIAATTQLLGALERNHIRPVSLGNVNGRYFLFHVGLGYDATVVAEVEKRALFKRYLGAVVFMAAAGLTWIRFDRSSPWFSMRAPGIEIADGYFAVCLKTSPYTFIGEAALDVAPGTGFDSGLSLLSFRTLTLPTVFSLALASWQRRPPRHRSVVTSPAGPQPVAPRPGPRHAMPGRRRAPLIRNRVQLTRGLDFVEVIGYRPVPYQVDGDYLGEADQLTLRCVPDALRLVVPSGAEATT
jgi:diacylglycerol kinase family enzyme